MEKREEGEKKEDFALIIVIVIAPTISNAP